MELRNIHIALELWGAFFCMVTAVCAFAWKKSGGTAGKMLGWLLVSNAVLLTADTFAWFFRGNPTMTGYVGVRVSNFLVFVENYIMLFFFVRYLYYILPAEKRKQARRYMRIADVINIIATLLLILSQFTNFYYYFDEHNYYHRTNHFWMATAIGLLEMAICFVVLLKNRKSLSQYLFAVLVFYTVIPVTASLIQILVYGIAILNLGITIAALLVFMTFEIGQSRALVRAECALSNMQVEILLSQIKPHFLFNILATIKYLCREDPEQAAQTVDDLSRYLRENVDTVNQKAMIPVQQEVERVKNYVLLEKRRFGDRVNVDYDIGETDFRIPSFSLQPLVENAIKHGITKRLSGGTVKICTGASDEVYYVCVEDDGVGFDVTSYMQKQEGHVGLLNVQARLSNLCGGRLEMSSKPGEGSRAVICIPKEKPNAK